MEKTFKIPTADGLHARPAGLLVKALSQFKSTIEVEYRGTKKNAKSIMSLMSLGIAGGDEIKVLAQGEDAEAAMSAIQQLFDKNFSE